jgi:PEP-CTERM motif
MNKILVTTILALASAGASFAQGTISFGNQVGTGFISPIYDANPGAPTVQQTGNSTLGKPAGSTVYGGALLSGSGFDLALYYAPSSATPLASYILAGFQPFRTAASPAALPNGLISTTTYTLNQGAGTTISYFVAAWANGGTVSPVAGTTWGNSGISLASKFGISGVSTSGSLGGTDSGGNLFLPPSTTGFTSFSVTGAAVPEPTTFALAGLGAAAMLVFRRRK